MMESSYAFTPDDLMVVCMARQIRDGEIVAQGLATPLVAAAYLLARRYYTPNLYFASAIGQGVCRQPAPLSITHVEKLWLDRSLANASFVRAAADILPCYRPIEFFRPAQVDPCGNFNNIAFGRDYRFPRLRLPGSGGIPDLTPVLDDTRLYVPRHSRLTFVEQLDFLSGLGYHPARTRGSGPKYLITDLGQFDFANGRMRLTSFHPGISIQHIQARTGFALEIAPDVHETLHPSPEEIHLLRTELDPLNIRSLESLSGSARRERLRAILLAEAHA